jgi:hypothetical protein
MAGERFCARCGTRAKADAHFCAQCGNRLGDEPDGEPGDAPRRHAEYARQSAAMRSYTTPAIVTLALYCLFWIPGLIANIVYLVAANDDRRKSGVAPQGRGCLIALLLIVGGLPLLLFVISTSGH